MFIHRYHGRYKSLSVNMRSKALGCHRIQISSATYGSMSVGGGGMNYCRAFPTSCWGIGIPFLIMNQITRKKYCNILFLNKSQAFNTPSRFGSQLFAPKFFQWFNGNDLFRWQLLKDVCKMRCMPASNRWSNVWTTSKSNSGRGK